MDRRTLLGFALIGIMLVLYQLYLAPKPTPPPPTATPPPDSTRAAIPPTSTPAAESTQVVVRQVDTLTQEDENRALVNQYGVFAAVAKPNPTSRRLKVVTDKLELELDGHGGRITTAFLKEYKTFGGQPLPVLLPDGFSGYTLQLAHAGRVINTHELYYADNAPAADISLQGKDSLVLQFVAEVRPGARLVHSYHLYGDRYTVRYNLQAEGLARELTNNSVDLSLALGVPRTEQSAEAQGAQTTLYYRNGDEVDYLSPTDDEKQEAGLYGNVDWVCAKSQFFNWTVIPRGPTESATLTQLPATSPEARTLKRMEASIKSPFSNQQATAQAGFTFYFGPNDRYILSRQAPDLEEVVNLGWFIFGGVNKYIILPVFKLLEGITTSYGLIIFLLAVLIKMVTFPLTYRSYKSNAKMQVVNRLPEVKELDEKFKDDPLKLQQQKSAFYKTVGVNPLAGCIPVLLQLPILGAMFSFFPQSIELRQEAFWWAKDLSSYDPIVLFGFSVPFLGDHLSGFAILMTISQIYYTWLSQQGQTMTGPAAQLKWMGYVFPIIFFGVLNSYSASLSYYYFVVNMITIVQTYAIRATINEDAIHAQLEAARAQNKKGGPGKQTGITKWLESQQKKQEAVLRERRRLQQGKGRR